MRDTWYADKRDLIKWGVLLCLAERFDAQRIVQVAYYRPTKFGSLIIDHQECDLPAEAIAHFRNLRAIDHLKSKVHITLFDRPFEDRAMYCQSVLATLPAFVHERCIVFLDPDTGLESKNPSHAHVLGAEARAIWSAMKPNDVFAFYQHRTNRSKTPWVEPKRTQLADALDVEASMLKIANGPDIADDVVIFFAQKTEPETEQSRSDTLNVECSGTEGRDGPMTAHPPEACACSSRQRMNGETWLEHFAAVRSGCPALRLLFVPDDLWPDFEVWHRTPDPVAYHASVLYLGLERGYLGHITSPLHRYLLEAGQVRPGVRMQYVKDLRERWMFNSDAMERHRKYRMFQGRVAELHIAEWLESQDGTVTGLEALREGPDIEGLIDGRPTACEVKYIGSEDGDFAIMLESLAEGAAGGAVSAYDPVNYLLFRAYEAAKQLQRHTSDHIAILVINELTWYRFDMQLRDRWINWSNPEFFAGHDWPRFMEFQRNRYPDLATDLRPTLRGLSAVWIFKQTSDFQYIREYEIRP